MPNYQNGKIYKIVSSQTPLVYIGCTVQKLSTRFSMHKCDYRKYTNGEPYTTYMCI